MPQNEKVKARNIALKNKWGRKMTSIFQGKKIDKIRYLTEKEQNEFGFFRSAPVILFADGSFLVAIADEEMNAAGCLFTSSEEEPIIPTI